MKHKKTVFRYFITMAFAFAFVLGLTCGVSAANVPVSVSGNSGLTVSLNDNFTNSTTDVDAYMLSVSHSYWGTIIPGTGYTSLTYALTSDDVNVASDNQFSIRYNGNTYTCTITNYQVSYNSLGLGLASSSTAYQWQNRSLTLPSVTTPYNFLGWYSLSGTRYGGAGDNYSFAANTTLYAHYADRYTALFADADGTLYYQASGQAGDKITNPALVDPSKEGYNFTGWNTQPSGGGTAYVSGTSTYSADVVYYAQWTPKMYSYALTGTGDSATYTFTSSNHAYSTSTTDSYCYYGETLDLTIPTKTDYVFIGWQDQTDNLTYGNNVGGYIQYTVDGATTLTAKFIEDVDSFKLVRFIDADTGSIYAYEYRHVDENAVVAPSTPTKAGYSFVQWTNTENSADTLDPGDTINFGLNTSSGEKDYYAQWVGYAHELFFASSTYSPTGEDSETLNDSRYRTGDTIIFDCTNAYDGSGTAYDVDVTAQPGYYVTEITVNYTVGGDPVSATLPVGADGTVEWTVPVADYGSDISYTASAAKQYHAIKDYTDSETGLDVDVNGTDPLTIGSDMVAKAGDTVVFSVTPDYGCALDEDSIVVKSGDDSLYYTVVTNGTSNLYTFTMPDGDVRIYAESAKDAHTISTDTNFATIDSLSYVDTSAGSVTKNISVGSTEVPAGETVSFTASALDSYGLSAVNVVNTLTNNYVAVGYDPTTGIYSFTMPSASVKISVTAEKDKASLVMLDYDNTLLGIEVVNTGDTVTVNNTAGTITVGGDVYTASAVDGYTFDQWEQTSTGDQFNSSTAIRDYFIVKAAYNPLTYNIKLASGSNGSSADASVEVAYPQIVEGLAGTATATLTTTGIDLYTDDDVTVTATPDANYQITGVAVRAADGSTKVVETHLVSKDSTTGAWTYSFKMPAYAVEVAAYTEALPYNISVEEYGFPEGGTYTINGDTTTNADINQGDTVYIPVTPVLGYRISGITIYYYDNDGNIVYMKDQVKKKADGTTPIYYNESYNPNAESLFGITLKMPCADTKVEVTYEKVDYSLSTTCVESTWGSFTGIPATANVGDVIDFTVVANYGYNLKTLTIQYGALAITPITTATPTVDSVTGNTTYYYQFTMPASNVALTATFVKNQYTVTFVDYDGKTLETQLLNYLDKPTVPSIIPTKTGYHFIGWTKGSTLENPGAGNNFSSDVFNTTQATTIYATYEINNYGIDYVYDNAKGIVTGPADADYHETVSVNVDPEIGYKINDVTATYLDANGIKQTVTFTSEPSDMEAGGNYVFTMPAVLAGTNVTFTATFTEITRTVYLDNVAHATVTINGIDAEDYHVNANYNSTVTVKITPDAGYELTGLSVTNHAGDNPPIDYSPAMQSTGGSYTFTMPAYDVDVNVTIDPIEYNVSWNNDAHSMISNNIPGGYDYKSVVGFTVKPDVGYQIKSVKAYYLDDNGLKQPITFSSDEPTDLTATCGYVFTMPMNDVHIVVVTEPIIYDVNVTVNGDGAYRLNAEKDDVKSTTAAYKSTVKITPEPALGWELSTITASNTDAITDNHDGTYTLSMDNPQDVTVTITYIQTTYDISYNAPANGTISNNDLTKQYQHDVSFTVTPNDGYQIKSVVGTYTDENGKQQTITFKSIPSNIVTGGVYTFTMPATDVDIKVVFEPITYNVVTGAITGNGAIRLNTTDTANITAKFADTVTVTATPDKGWYLAALTVTNNKTNGTVTYSPALAAAGGDYTFTMPSSDVTVTATFAQITYNISTNYITDQGDVTVQSTATESEKVNFTVTPKYGYKISNVYYKGADGERKTPTKDADGKYYFTMPAQDITITALFEKLTYQVTFLDYNNKAIGETQYIDYLDPATAPTAPTREGYTFTGWDKDFSSVTQDMNVTAQYKVNTPTVTVASTANGATSVNDTTPDYGSTVTVTADPADGYRYDSISVVTAGGKPVSSTFISESNNYVTTFTFTMPDDNVTVTVNYTEYASSDYTDVRTDAWYYTAINFVSDKGYFYGVSGNLFAPDQTMTRAMFVTVLGRLYGVDTSLYTTSSFEDVNANTWYGPYVAWAAANKIVAGYGDRNGNGTAEFGPNDNVTREQMAAIMYRYATFGGYDTSVKNQDWMTKYTDSGLASSYASDAIAWCVGNGIILGNSNTTINPLGNATRAEVAQVIKNFVDKVIYQ